MRAALLFVLCAFLLLVVVTFNPRMLLLPATAFAQQGVQPPLQQDTKGIQARMISPTFAGPPAGRPALPIDLFLSQNFYKDRALWSDQRYFRCNTPRQLTDIWTSHRIGQKAPASAAWGDCSIDYPRSEIVSPYPYKTAKEHYEALLAAAKAKGGPTIYTKATVPDWDGYYGRDRQYQAESGDWLNGTVNQTPTILSLLTPEYQTRMVQGNYHEAVNNSPQWNASFCYPEGFLRWWIQAGAGEFSVMTTTWNVQFTASLADNFIRQVLIGKQHVQKVPQWYGETVGFWDGTTLVAWTANVQAWTLTHSMFDFSDKMETVETWKPVQGAGGKFIGLDHEVVFYDPEAFVQPLHATYRYLRHATPDDPNRRYTYVECLSNLKNVNGIPTQLTSSDPRYIDYYGRPWAQDWEKYFEVGWDKPSDNSVPSDVLNIFK